MNSTNVEPGIVEKGQKQQSIKLILNQSQIHNLFLTTPINNFKILQKRREKENVIVLRKIKMNLMKMTVIIRALLRKIENLQFLQGIQTHLIQSRKKMDLQN
jgi:hypothetical protein